MSLDLLRHKQTRVQQQAARLDLAWEIAQDKHGQVELLIWNPKRRFADQVLVRSWHSPQTGRDRYLCLVGMGADSQEGSGWRRVPFCRVDADLERISGDEQP